MPWKKYLGGLVNFDWILFGAVCLLICFGLAALYSITISFDQPDFGNFKKQIIFAIIGMVFLFGLSLVDYRVWRDYSYIIYGLMALVLLAVIFFGKTLRGTTGWFSIFGINFQPVEMAKIVLVLFLSWFYSNHLASVKELKNFLIAGICSVVFFGLVILQPDFGSAMILFFIWLALAIFSGASKKHLLILGLIAVILFICAWAFFFQDFQRDRILTFINPQADPYGRGYHVRQAVTAVGAGGIFGRGLGFGSQSQLKFIPASETDFIFAVIAEELGFLGVGLVLFFLGIIFYRLARAARNAKDSFAVFFIYGFSVILFCQVMVNIGMNVGIVPVTGISLPFISYGGSFLVTCLMLVGMTESMIIRNQA